MHPHFLPGCSKTCNNLKRLACQVTWPRRSPSQHSVASDPDCVVPCRLSFLATVLYHGTTRRMNTYNAQGLSFDFPPSSSNGALSLSMLLTDGLALGWTRDAPWHHCLQARYGPAAAVCLCSQLLRPGRQNSTLNYIYLSARQYERNCIL